MPVFTAIAAIASVVAGIGAAAAGAVGLTVGTIGATAIGGGLIGACIGGAVAAVKGENILKGALKGGLIGAAAGGLLGWGAEALAAKGLVGAEAASSAGAGAGMSTQTAGSFMGLDTGISGVGMTTVEGAAAGSAAGGAGGMGKLGAFWAGLSGSDKTLLLATGAEAVSGAMGPDEEELLERKAELEREAMRVSGIGDIEDFRARVDWKKFEQPAFDRTSTNRFKDFNKSFTPELFTNNAGPTDANLYRISGPTPGAESSKAAPSATQQPPTGSQQPPTGSQPKPQPQSMLGK